MNRDLQRFSDKIGDIITDQTNSDLSVFKQILNECDSYAIEFHIWFCENQNIQCLQEAIEVFKKEYLIRNSI